jgi:ATP-dependent Lon protease
MREVGGTKETTTAKECIREFKDIVGRRLPLALAPDMTRVRSTLHDEFPYAQQQVDLLLTGMIEGEPIKWRHALLVSKPGSGKSRLARRVAEELGVGLHRFDGSGSSDNAFGGTPRRWSSGEHCTPLEAVRRHKIANVLCLIDEIDKSGKSRHNGRLEHVLMPFLEKETAKNYPDPYVESDLNLSHVGFFLTCNSVDEIPAPLRDRLRVIRLPDPGREHLAALVRSIVTDLGKEDPRWTPMLDDGECAIAETLWKGGSVRRLVAIVERILAYREAKPRN